MCEITIIIIIIIITSLFKLPIHTILNIGTQNSEMFYSTKKNTFEDTSHELLAVN